MTYKQFFKRLRRACREYDWDFQKYHKQILHEMPNRSFVSPMTAMVWSPDSGKPLIDTIGAMEVLGLSRLKAWKLFDAMTGRRGYSKPLRRRFLKAVGLV